MFWKKGTWGVKDSDQTSSKTWMRVWGEIVWGRPGECDVLLKEKQKDVENNILTLFFDENRKCTIYNPIDIVCNDIRLSIQSADKIVLESFGYGMPQAESLCIEEYTFIDSKHIQVVAKCSWFKRDEIFKPKSKVAINII